MNIVCSGGCGKNANDENPYLCEGGYGIYGGREDRLKKWVCQDCYKKGVRIVRDPPAKKNK